MRTELLRFNGAVERDPAIDAWMKEHAGELGAIAHQWFEAMRKSSQDFFVAVASAMTLQSLRPRKLLCALRPLLP